MALRPYLLLLQLLLTSRAAEVEHQRQPPQDTVSLLQVAEAPQWLSKFGKFAHRSGDEDGASQDETESKELPAAEEGTAQEQEQEGNGEEDAGDAAAVENDEEKLEKDSMTEEKEESGELGRQASPPTEAPAPADPEKIRLKEMHDKLVAEMREKIRAEADQRVKQKMVARYAARQQELKKLKEEEKARQEQLAAAKAEQKRLDEEQAKERKRQLEREKAERHQSYLIAQQMKLEAEKEAVRKKQAAAARLVELEAKQAEIAKRKEEQQALVRSEAEEVPAENDQSINLRLRDGLNREIVVKVNKGGHMRPMMNVACQRFGLDRSHALFSFNGEQVGSFDTPETMSLENGDVLTVLEQEGVVKDKPYVQVQTGKASHRVETVEDAQQPQEVTEVTEEEAKRAVEESLNPASVISAEEEAKAFHTAKDAILEALHQINVDVVEWLKKTDRAWPVSFLSAVDKRSKALGWTKPAQRNVAKEAKTFAATKVSSLREDLWAYVHQCKDEVKAAMDQLAEVGTLARKKREVELTTGMVRKVRKWTREVDESFENQFEEWWAKKAH